MRSHGPRRLRDGLAQPARRRAAGARGPARASTGTSPAGARSCASCSWSASGASVRQLVGLLLHRGRGLRRRLHRAGRRLRRPRAVVPRAARGPAPRAAGGRVTQRIEAADAYRELGDRVAVDDPASAEVAYRRALDFEPALPDVYVRLAATLVRLGRLCEAEGHLRAARRLDARHEERRAALGRPAAGPRPHGRGAGLPRRLRAGGLAPAADGVRRRARAHRPARRGGARLPRGWSRPASAPRRARTSACCCSTAATATARCRSSSGRWSSTRPPPRRPSTARTCSWSSDG